MNFFGCRQEHKATFVEFVPATGLGQVGPPRLEFGTGQFVGGTAGSGIWHCFSSHGELRFCDAMVGSQMNARSGGIIFADTHFRGGMLGREARDGQAFHERHFP